MSDTLLQITQDILSSIDGDEVNSISDTVESRQVVTILRTVWRDIWSRSDLPEHFSWVSLEPSLDPTKPTLMRLPDDVVSLQWVKYDNRTATETAIRMVEVTPVDNIEFAEAMHQLNSDEDTVGTFQHTVGTHTFTVLYQNNKAPERYTSFNDRTLLFDSYDAGVDVTLQKSKTFGYGKTIPVFLEQDTFIPVLDNTQTSLFYNEAKSLAWAELRQAQHAKAEQSARRGWVKLQVDKEAVEVNSEFSKLPNYGR